MQKKNPGELGFGDEFLEISPKVYSVRRKIDYLCCNKISALRKLLLREWRDSDKLGENIGKRKIR